MVKEKCIEHDGKMYKAVGGVEDFRLCEEDCDLYKYSEVCEGTCRLPSSLVYKEINEEAKDKKWDQGKVHIGQMKRDFPRALLAVAEVTSYGIKKYNQPGSWRYVEDALKRYEDAHGRHDIEMNVEDYDQESELLHAAHRAWNALATLEMILEDKQLRMQ